MNKDKLSFIVPCYNEEKRLGRKFSQIYKFLEERIKSFEIILVNDGSKDKTEEIIKDIAKSYKNVLAINYSQNRGKGYAVKKGIEKAQGQIIGFTDADFAIDLKHLPAVLEKLRNEVDIVIGDRKAGGSRLTNEPDKIRRIFSFLHTRINNYFLDLGPVRDTLCGFKFFKKHIAKELFKNLSIYRWFFDLEVLIKARLRNYKIYQQPVEWEEVRGGQVKILPSIYTSVKDHLIIYSNFFNIKIFTVLLSVILFVAFIPFLIKPDSLTRRNGDFSDLVWPNYFFIKRSILDFGQIPLWNPTLFSGIPEIANPQSPLIYPPNILAFVLPIDLAIVLLIIGHALVAGIYLFLIGRNFLKFSNLATIIFSIGIVFSPFIFSKIAVGHISMVFAMYLGAPVIFYTYSLYTRFSFNKLFLAAMFLSLQYLNYPTIWYYTCFFGGILLFLSNLVSFKKYWLLLLPFCSIGLILPIFLIHLQAGEYITRTVLTTNDLAIPLWSFKRFLISIFVPSSLLNDNEVEVWLYPSIFLILASALGFIKSTRKQKYVLGLIILLCLLITLGNRTPIFNIFTNILPGFKYLRVSTRDWFVIIFIVAYLAAFFVNRLKGRLLYILFSLCVIDILIFSILRLWVVPEVMAYRKNPYFENLLKVDINYRYYCTSRCISPRESLPQNIYTADGYHLMILRDYRDVLAKAGGFERPKYTGNLPTVDDFGKQPSSELLGQLAVKWVISRYPLEDKNFKIHSTSGVYTLYENTKALPRIRLLSGEEIKIHRDTPNIIEIETLEAGGMLVVADSYYPGWKVFIDGKESEIVKFNNWARAVEVPVGEHLIEFKYKPFNHLR